jgi:hypothetical protein
MLSVIWKQLHLKACLHQSALAQYTDRNIFGLLDISMFKIYRSYSICCQFLWIVLFYLCSFSILIVVSFSGLSWFICVRFLYSLLSVSLDCLDLFVLVFCTHCCQFIWIVLFYKTIQRNWQQWVQKTKTNKSRQSRETDNNEYRKRTQIKDCLVLFVFVFCTHCCQFLWIVLIYLS